MFSSGLSSLLSAWFAFFLPCYATFKVLSQRPINEADLQKYAIYWCVIGAFVAFVYVTEWLISWLPFYWEVKTIFLLYLSLPQIQGSTYIYSTFLQPFFLRNERELDSGIVTLQRKVLTFLQSKFAAVWELIGSLSTKQQQPASQGSSPVPWLSPDAVRAALSMVYSPPIPRQNSNGESSPGTPAVPPPFPVTQHVQPST